ncbi:HIT domain-containing protein [Streptomyces sp. IF17]|nr:HIT domain-containing protein [Streptomyces alkaliphilus]
MYQRPAPERAGALTAEVGRGFVLLPSRRQNVPNRGYALLLAGRHVPDLDHLDVADLPAPWRALRDAAETVRRTAGAPGLTLRLNQGPPAQHIPHLHGHLVPRRPGDGHDGWPRTGMEPIPNTERLALAARFREVGAEVAPVSPEEDGCPFGDCHGESDGPTVVHADRWARVDVARSQRPGHRGEVWVRTTSHVTRLRSLPDETGGRLLRAVREAGRRVRAVTGADGLTIRCHDGPPDGVPGHVLFRVIPRWIGDTFADETPTPVDPADLTALAHHFIGGEPPVIPRKR